MVKVLFFASLREQIGQGQTEVEHLEGETALQLWQRVTDQEALPGQVRIAINQEYSPADTLITNGMEVAFFPPVTGG